MKLRNQLNFSRPFAILVSATLLSPAYGAESLDAHVHGEVQLDIAVEGQEMAVWLKSPAINLVGFERSPENEAEEQLVQNAIAALEDANQVLGVPAALGCQVTKSMAALVTEAGAHDDHEHDGHGDDEHAHDEHEHEEHEEHAKKGEEHDNHGHEEKGHDEHGDEEHGHDDKGHEHGDEHDSHEDKGSSGQHAEFQAEYAMQCETLEDATLRFGLFEQYPGIEEVEVRGVLPEGQIAKTLVAGDAEIRLGGN